MAAPTVPVREMSSAEADAVAQLHRRVFPDYESSQLGPAFCRHLIAAYHRREDTRVFVVGSADGTIEGYLVGAPPASQRLVNDALVVRAALASMKASLRSRSQAADRIRRARRAITSRLRKGTPPTAVADEKVRGEPEAPASLRVVLVGVAPERRGTGAGAALLAAFEAWARSGGHRRADLSVAADNADARTAYERAGWRLLALEGEGTTARYVLDLEATRAP